MSWFKSKPETSAVVPVYEKFAYGLRAVSQQLGSNGITMFAFPAYGIILGLNPAVIGAVFALMRIYDAFTDPLMGWISDNTRSRWGRRRPYMFAGALLGGLTFALLWMPSPEWSDTMKTAYFVGLSLLFYTSYTMMDVPAVALGWEMTPDYSERTRVMTWFSVTIKIVLLVLPWMFALTQSSVWSSEAEGLKAVGILFGIIYALTGVVPALVCKERNFKLAAREGRQGFWKGLRLTFRNRTFLLVCGIAIMCVFGGQVYMLFGVHLTVYYLSDGLKAEGAKLFGIFGVVASISGLVTIALINRLFIAADKKMVMLGAIGCAFFGWVLAVFLVTPSHPWLILIPIGLNAVGVAGFWLLLGSVLADVADEDELNNGHRREGALAAGIAFSIKVAGTLGAVLGGWVLGTTGFNAEVGQQSLAALMWMKGVYVGFPLVGYAGALFLTLRYPLSRKRMIEIRAMLEERRGKTDV